MGGVCPGVLYVITLFYFPMCVVHNVKCEMMITDGKAELERRVELP